MPVCCGSTGPGALTTHKRAEPESERARTAVVMVTATRKLVEAAAAVLLVCVLPPKKTMVVPLFSCCGNPAACGFCPVDFTLLHATVFKWSVSQQLVDGSSISN